MISILCELHYCPLGLFNCIIGIADEFSSSSFSSTDSDSYSSSDSDSENSDSEDSKSESHSESKSDSRSNSAASSSDNRMRRHLKLNRAVDVAHVLHEHPFNLKLLMKPIKQCMRSLPQSNPSSLTQRR